MWQFLLHILAGGTAGLHMLTLVTVAAVPDHRCLVEGVESALNATYNDPEAFAFIPEGESCRIIGEDNETLGCSQWVYDTQYHKSSRAIEVARKVLCRIIIYCIYYFSLVTSLDLFH
jgi:MFS transporter, OCT family, solute carrier family 22 (organic cation transporter), member 16